MATLLAVAAVAACAPAGPAPDAVGTLERDRIELVAETNDPIARIAVREGDRVEAGAVLLELDPRRLRAELARAEAARDRARARLAEIERGTRPELLREAAAELEAAEARLADAARERARLRKLAREGAAPAAELDRAERAWREARALRDAARARLERLEAGATAEERAQAEAAVREAEAAVAALAVRLERLVVRAPRAGWVEALPYEEGERPPPGGVVAVLLADGPPYVRAYVPEALRARVDLGTEAVVRVDGLDRPLRGRVRWIAREATFTPFFALTRYDRGRLAYPAEIELELPDGTDVPVGMPAEVRFARARGGGRARRAPGASAP